jgi:hypothetical protein
MEVAEEPALARLHAAQQRPVTVTKTTTITTQVKPSKCSNVCACTSLPNSLHWHVGLLVI